VRRSRERRRRRRCGRRLRLRRRVMRKRVMRMRVMRRKRAKSVRVMMETRVGFMMMMGMSVCIDACKWIGTVLMRDFIL
jgi:hypothetical protein